MDPFLLIPELAGLLCDDRRGLGQTIALTVSRADTGVRVALTLDGEVATLGDLRTLPFEARHVARPGEPGTWDQIVERLEAAAPGVDTAARILLARLVALYEPIHAQDTATLEAARAVGGHHGS